jgi:hypothetical protein
MLNGLDDAFLVDDKGDPFSKAKNRNQHAVGPRHNSLRIAQDGEFQSQRLCETAILSLVVDADCDHLRVCALESCDIILIRLKLARSATRKRLDIKRQNDILLSPIVAEPHFLSVLVVQTEVRRGVSCLTLLLT